MHSFEISIQNLIFLYLISDEKEKYTNHTVENHDIIEKYLVNYFSNFKFMTIHFCCLYDDLSVSEKIRNITISNIDSRIDVILCVENKCHIIENINFLLIKPFSLMNCHCLFFSFLLLLSNN